MRNRHLVIFAALCVLSACRSATTDATSIGWVLEDAGTDDDGNALTKISIYADTVEKSTVTTNIYGVETLPGCAETQTGEVQCVADGHADQFRLRWAPSRKEVTFDHRRIEDGQDEAAVPFRTHHAFDEETFGTALEAGPSRTKQALGGTGGQKR